MQRGGEETLEYRETREREREKERNDNFKSSILGFFNDIRLPFVTC